MDLVGIVVDVVEIVEEVVDLLQEEVADIHPDGHVHVAVIVSVTGKPLDQYPATVFAGKTSTKLACFCLFPKSTQVFFLLFSQGFP